MKLRSGVIGEVRVSGSRVVAGVRRVRCVRCIAVFGLMLAFAAWLAGTSWATEVCPNEAVRTGPSADLPDCRAYEMVTPVNKSSASQDLDRLSTEAIAAADGNKVALYTLATLGTTPQLNGSFSMLSRTVSGWVIASVPPSDAGSTLYIPQIFSPNLEQVGLDSYAESPRSSGETFQVGVPGGPYDGVTTPFEGEGVGTHKGGSTKLLGASPDFSHVVLASTDHALLSAEPTGTDEEAYDLYELVNGQLRLVNVSEGGSVIGKCGATLGDGEFGGGGAPELEPDLAHNAVSTDGSKVFFTSPDPDGQGEGCPNLQARLAPDAPSLYMRVTEMIDGQEESRTVDLSRPNDEVHISRTEEEEMPVFYEGASMNGAKVFFLTERVLTKDARSGEVHLYEDDTEAPEGEGLTLAFHRISTEGLRKEAEEVFVSDDGSVAYIYGNSYTELFRYEAAGGGSVHMIASMMPPGGNEAPYSTPDGEFLLFASGGVDGEPRGAGHNELYRYDHASGSVICVSCGPGPGNAPPKGNAFTGTTTAGEAALHHFTTPDLTPETILMSDDGSRVFFDSTASLVPQAVNEGVVNVYEWEADGAGACTQDLGCTYLISQGDSSSHSLLIGASSDGSNVFFLTHAELLPQDTDTSDDIYDARVDGGFPAPTESAPCLGDTCLNPPVASIEPTLGTSVSNGIGNIAPVLAKPPKPKSKRCGKGDVRQKGRCVTKGRARKINRHVVKRDRGGFK
jgi:hypothetical protein